jgi:uncharacterized domain HDIG
MIDKKTPKQIAEYKEFYDSISDILRHPVVREMRNYLQHCDTHCYRHCLAVAYYNFRICKRLRLDAISAARGGMLHDLFLYDWREHFRETGNRFHALSHPGEAYHIASEYFKLNDVESEVIKKHMWPITIIPPKHLETYVICFTDKYCGTLEIFEYYTEKWKRFFSKQKDKNN